MLETSGFFRGQSLGARILDVFAVLEIGPREGLSRRNSWPKHFFNGSHSLATFSVEEVLLEPQSVRLVCECCTRASACS